MLRSIAVIAAAFAALAAAPAAASAQGQRGQRAAGCPLESKQFHQCALEKAKTFNPPRTPEGVPDFRGYWDSQHNGSIWDFEPRPGQGPIAPASTGLRVDGPDTRIPYQPQALAKRNALAPKKFEDPTAHCARTTTPRTNLTVRGLQIVQPPGSVVFLYENFHDFSIIPTDGRGHRIPESIKLWHADGVGRWEGNTLVVDYANANGKQWLDQSGNFQSEQTHIVERYTMVDPDTIHFEATISDPTIYTQPWTIALALTRNKEDGYYLLEYACHEGERDLQHYTEADGKGQSDVFVDPGKKD
jgi:hypothetical protein